MIKSTNKGAPKIMDIIDTIRKFNRICTFLLLPLIQTNIAVGQPIKQREIGFSLVEKDDHA